MSPLWRDEVIIGLAPGRLELVRRRGGRNSPVECAAVIDLAPGEGWAGAVSALGEALAHPQWQRARCHLVLSNHHVRFAMIEAPSELAGGDEQIAYVELRFRAIYGERATAWEITFAPFDRNRRTLACAMDRGLLDALRSCMATARLTLVSVQPYLVSAFNRVAAAVRGENTWFVTVEPGRLTMAAFVKDRWACVRSEPLRGDVAESIAGMLAQDALARQPGGTDRCAFVHAPGWDGRLVAPAPGWSMRRTGALRPDDMRALDPAAFPLTSQAHGLA